MGPYGSVRAHIKTGKRYMAQDHFKTPPDPKKGRGMFKNHGNLSEMGPYCSVGAHIKTGRSLMAQDHFKTPPDPKKDHGMTKNPQKSKKSSRVGQVA